MRAVQAIVGDVSEDEEANFNRLVFDLLVEVLGHAFLVGGLPDAGDLAYFFELIQGDRPISLVSFLVVVKDTIEEEVGFSWNRGGRPVGEGVGGFACRFLRCDTIGP